ncbi:MAG: pyridoxal-phosphate dependent enzyme, partial [Acidimicrobiia bacterium]
MLRGREGSRQSRYSPENMSGLTTLEEIREAGRLHEGRVLLTPLLASNSFSHLSGRTVYLKAECLQRTGSFKIRGALNVLSRLDERRRSAGVVAASAGNHAQGVALAASLVGSPCMVFMPETAAIPKVKATQDYGAE